MKVKITEIEKNLIEQAILSNEEFILHYKILPIKNHFYIEADEDNLINIRECCCDYLMMVGFNDNYTPTKEGIILENLIDKLYTG